MCTQACWSRCCAATTSTRHAFVLQRFRTRYILTVMHCILRRAAACDFRCFGFGRVPSHPSARSQRYILSKAPDDLRQRVDHQRVRDHCLVLQPAEHKVRHVLRLLRAPLHPQGEVKAHARTRTCMRACAGGWVRACIGQFRPSACIVPSPVKGGTVGLSMVNTRHRGNQWTAHGQSAANKREARGGACFEGSAAQHKTFNRSLPRSDSEGLGKTDKRHGRKGTRRTQEVLERVQH